MPSLAPRASLLVVVALLAAGAPHLRAQEDAERRVSASSTTASADYTLQSFNGAIDAWQLASVSVGRRTRVGSLIVRANHARRFGSAGLQAEVDAYPRVADGIYAYLNAGYSAADVFPAWRSGAELFASLPRAYEASLGYRQLRFGGAPVTLLTGSVGRYAGNYWFSLRPYVRRKPAGTSASVGLTARRYYEDGDHFIGVRGSLGSAPGDQPAADQVERTGALSVGIHGSTPLSRVLLGTWSLGFDREEPAPGSHRNSETVSVGLKWRL